LLKLEFDKNMAFNEYDHSSITFGLAI